MKEVLDLCQKKKEEDDNKRGRQERKRPASEQVVITKTLCVAILLISHVFENVFKVNFTSFFF